MISVHGLSLVHPNAQLSEDTTVGPWCLVEEQVFLGAGTRLNQSVVVRGRTVLGRGNIVHAFTVLGGEPQVLKTSPEPQQLVIGDSNIIREHVTINAGAVHGRGGTVVGDHNLVMSGCHIGHDARVGSNCVIASGTQLAGHVELGSWAWLGGGVSVAQRVRIGAHAFIGGHSGIDRDVPPFCVAYGTRPPVLRGCNLVGLRRRNFARQRVAIIRQIVNIWRDMSLTRDAAVREIERCYGGLEDTEEFLCFIRATSVGVLR